MSTCLRYEPVRPAVSHELECGGRLTTILRARYDQPFMLEGATLCVDCTSDVEYLNGLVDAGVPGARELRAAMTEYGTIRVFEVD